MTRPSAILPLLVLLAPATSPFVEGRFSQEQAAEIFKEYDRDEDESPDCRMDDGFDEQFCPSDESLGCGPIPQIEEHCKNILGDFAVEGLPTDTGVNAIEGCVRYVGYHVFDDKHIACCESDVCDEWIDEEFDIRGGHDDIPDVDDDEGYYHDGDEDEF